MKEINEATVEESNEELSTLKESLRQAVDNGDIKKAGELRTEIMPHLEALREKVGISLEKAKEIMGEDFLGPEAVENTFGIKLEESDIPRIPFSEKDIERAKLFDQFLILRVDKSRNGFGLTVGEMERSISGRRVKMINSYSSKGAEPPRTGWALVDKEPRFAPFDYIEETESLIEYIKQYFLSGGLPEQYQKAIDDFKERKQLIKNSIDLGPGGSFPDHTAGIVADSDINKLSRQTISEAAYDVCVNYINNPQRFADNYLRIRSGSALGDSLCQLNLIGRSSSSNGDVTGITLSIGARAYSFGPGEDIKKEPGFVFSRRS
ncbi:MAG: hypothetical protein Q7S53_05250 [bacterium]|nr:hypothetical protein [bacterium]